VQTATISHGASLIPGFTASNVTLIQNGTTIGSANLTKSVGDSMAVQVDYTFTFLVKGFSTDTRFPFSSYPITVKSQTRSEG